jgi:hypothetical protein
MTAKTSNKPAAKIIAYDVALDRGRRALAAGDKTAWTLGDIANAVEVVTYGAGTIQKLADDLGVEYRTLMDMRKVAQQYAPATKTSPGERSALNSHTVHQIFGRQPKRAELVAARKWTTPEARAEVKRLNGSDDIDPIVGDGDGDGDGNGNSEVDERAKLIANIDRLKGQLATAVAALAAYDAEHTNADADADADATPATVPAAKVPAATVPAVKLATLAGATVKTPAKVPAAGAPGSIAAKARAANAAKVPAAPRTARKRAA